MKNKDLMAAAKTKLAKNLKAALDANDEQQIAQALDEHMRSVENYILEAAQEFAQTADSAVLANRGIRQLTSAEQKFFSDFAEAAQAPEPKQALSNLDLTIPETTVDTVIEDIAREHPLLEALNIVNARGAVKWIFAKNPKQLAAWGKITAAFTKELEGSIGVVKFEDSKLSTFLPVPKDLIRLGATYIGAYVMKVLADALACGLEYGAIRGTGKDEPIGMCKDLKGSVVEGVYPDKTAVELKSLEIDEYNSVVAQLAKDEDGNYRVVKSVALIVNPVDYLSKVLPATTVRGVDGTYKSDIFPFPTTVYQSEMIDEGDAILGILENYVMALSTGKSGNIEYSDHAQFLQDNRVYIVFLLGTGRAKSNTDFILLDISELKPYKLKVEVTNIADKA